MIKNNDNYKNEFLINYFGYYASVIVQVECSFLYSMHLVSDFLTVFSYNHHGSNCAFVDCF